jgi:hypothetical protein
MEIENFKRKRLIAEAAERLSPPGASYFRGRSYSDREQEALRPTREGPKAPGRYPVSMSHCL